MVFIYFSILIWNCIVTPTFKSLRGCVSSNDVLYHSNLQKSLPKHVVWATKRENQSNASTWAHAREKTTGQDWTVKHFGDHRLRRFRMTAGKIAGFSLTFDAVFITLWHYQRVMYCIDDPSPDWNCQWARITYTRAMSEHRCFPKTRLSTHTMRFKWHHRNLSTNDHESLERKRIMNNHKLLYYTVSQKSSHL